MFWKVTLALLEGFGQNAIIFFVTLFLSLPLGLVIAFGVMSKNRILSSITKTAIWIIRGTPLMLQLFVVFYVPGLVFGMPFHSRMTATLIAFVINYSAYFAEIYRGAIESIHKQQFEAGYDLGSNKFYLFVKVILPQAFVLCLAPMGNEVITLIKDTSLARVIAISEILMRATEYTTQGLIWPLFYTGVFFLAGTAVITKVFRGLEKRFRWRVVY